MCYDHLAGRLGVSVCDMMLRREVRRPLGRRRRGDRRPASASSPGSAWISGPRGERSDTTAAPASTGRSAAITSPAPIGAALADAFLERGWVARIPDSRALTITVAGRKQLSGWRIDVPESDGSLREGARPEAGRPVAVKS